MLARYGQIDVLGFVIVAGIAPKLRYLFFPMDVRAPDMPLQIIQATPLEIALAEDIVKLQAEEGEAPIDFLKREVVEILAIQGLEVAHDLDTALDVVILEALSGGHVANANGRLHTLVIGPPASGKKLLSEASAILNVAHEAIGHKVTPAGLVGACGMTGHGFSTRPGALARAHRGTVVFQDFHALGPQKWGKIWGIVSGVMEDGVAHDSTAGSTSFTANTAVRFDFNRAQDLYPGLVDGSADVKKLPMNLISRFDCVIEIEGDAGRQIDVASRIVSSVEKVGSSAEDPHAEMRRLLPVVVALLRERYPEITFSDDCRQYAKQRFDELASKVEPEVKELFGMCATRMANSVFKFAAANARGHLRAYATTDDIDVAIEHMEQKLEFLRKMAVPSSAGKEPKKSKKERRKDAIIGKLAGKRVTVEQCRDAAAEDGYRPSKQTIYRDLEELEEEGKAVRGHGFADVLPVEDSYAAMDFQVSGRVEDGGAEEIEDGGEEIATLGFGLEELEDEPTVTALPPAVEE